MNKKKKNFSLYICGFVLAAAPRFLSPFFGSRPHSSPFLPR
jgi:hypothetical protein